MFSGALGVAVWSTHPDLHLARHSQFALFRFSKCFTLDSLLVALIILRPLPASPIEIFQTLLLVRLRLLCLLGGDFLLLLELLPLALLHYVPLLFAFGLLRLLLFGWPD